MLLRPETLRARQLRKGMSLPEVMLWRRLRRSGVGVKFRRQHPIGPYVVDFYCPSCKLIVEIDGQAHDLEERADRDVLRDRFLFENRYDVKRIAATDILRDVDAALASIAALVLSPLHRPAAGPPPRAGEDRDERG